MSLREQHLADQTQYDRSMCDTGCDNCAQYCRRSGASLLRGLPVSVIDSDICVLSGVSFYIQRYICICLYFPDHRDGHDFSGCASG